MWERPWRRDDRDTKVPPTLCDCGRVDLPAACFNQYNVAVSQPDNQLNAVQRKLELRDAELKEAHRHIAALGTKAGETKGVSA